MSGPSGSGKTTLLATLVGWRAARAGDVACGARRVGMVSAESALLSATLRENLTLGRDVDPSRVRRLLEELGLDGPRFADLEVTLLADGRGLSGASARAWCWRDACWPTWTCSSSTTSRACSTRRRARAWPTCSTPTRAPR